MPTNEGKPDLNVTRIDPHWSDAPIALCTEFRVKNKGNVTASGIISIRLYVKRILFDVIPIGFKFTQIRNLSYNSFNPDE
ncbi:MAG: hypothetical protein KKC68_04395 [Candidatus Thermoplasmatota archaeon]|nr:hypothetical protein [Candidatus Thermoplasmatota archaeon]